MMTVIELHLDEQTLERARRVAIQRRATLETLIQELIDRLATAEAGDHTLLEMFAQEPELIDEVVKSAVVARERDRLRIPDVDPILALGTAPIASDVTDASDNHDVYLYEQ